MSLNSKLHNALLFCNMPELRIICGRCHLQASGTKQMLIARIMALVEGKKQPASMGYPANVCYRKGFHSVELYADAPILYGLYKNDLKTRLLLKKLIGEYFNFTVFGHEWIKAQWVAGLTPTYREFAQFWQQEYELRKQTGKKELKEEWAYLNFLQKPGATKEAWSVHREQQVQEAYRLLDQLSA